VAKKSAKHKRPPKI